MTNKQVVTALILILAVIASLSDGMAVIFVGEQEQTDSLTVQIDSLEVYAAEAESLTVIDGILIECANQANYPHNGGVSFDPESHDGLEVTQ